MSEERNIQGQVDGPSDRPAGWRQVIADAPQRGRILIVDDDQAVLDGLTKILTRLGHDVTPVGSAEEADSWLQAHSFDLLLLDVDLPGMNGTEFLSWSLSRHPEQPVIMLTGIDSPDMAIRCIEEGARTYLVKPVDADFLRLAVRDALALGKVLTERNRTASVV